MKSKLVPHPTVQENNHNNSLAFFGRGWPGCLLGEFELLLFSWSWNVLLGWWGGAHVHPWLLIAALLPLDAFLIHFSSSQIWEGLTQRFHRVIALDFLGFGFSDKPVSILR